MKDDEVDDPLKNIYSCRWDDCGTKFQSLPDLYSHMNEHLSQIPTNLLHCRWGNCRSQSSTINQLVTHVLQHCHHIKLMVDGFDILKKYKTEDRCSGLYNDYAISNHFSKAFVCSWGDCDLSFVTFDVFHSHIDFHLNSVPKIPSFICTWGDTCNYETNKFTNFKRHIWSHAQLKQVACPFCGVFLCTSRALRDHIARTTTTAIKDHICSVCSKSFVTAHLLKEHARFHDSTKTCPHCPQGFICEAHLRRHVDTCHNEKGRLFHCEKCPYKSHTLRGMRSHVLKHDKSRIFQCDECEYQTTSYPAFYEHFINNHASGKVYRCHFCGRTFKFGASCKRHLRLRHNVTVVGNSRRRIFKLQEDGCYSLEKTQVELISTSSKRSILRPQ